jgi:PAS domain S-box-containing protein
MIRIWRKPGAAALGLACAAAIVVLNFSAAAFGAGTPWLFALDLVLDLAVLGAMIAIIVQTSLQAEASEQRARRAVLESHERLAAVMDSAMDAIITIDQDQRVVLFNQAAEATFRCSRAEALGSTLERFLPARFRAAHHGHIENFGRTGVTNRRMGDTTTLWGVRADGEEFPIEASISQAREGGRQLFTVILRDITKRKAYEAMLMRQQADLRELSARVLEAREEEKTLLARELHDELGQLLTAMKMDLAWLRERLPGASPELAAKAAQMDKVLDNTVTSVRRISADLRPLMLDDLGLRDAIAWLTAEFSRHSSVACHLQAPEDSALEHVDRPVATTVYRVLQESLTNVARHARARNVWVVIGAGGNWLQLEVEDDGKGIVEPDLARSRSLGLKGMRERVLYHGGTVEVGRAPRGGTRVLVRLPRMASSEAGMGMPSGAAA